MRDEPPDPARLVADADVLAADLLVGGAARDALNQVRRHSWVELVASDQLLADATAVIRRLADRSVATAWRARLDPLRVSVGQPEQDHPGLASAYRGGAAHLLSFDESLTATDTNLGLQPHARLSVLTPTAFDRLFDPAALYEARNDGPYPGPDGDRN
jgi:predicted nucleic acid-binding protein